MNLLGIHLTLMFGKEFPSLASPFIVENLRSVEVTHPAEGPSGFQMTFHVGRSSVFDLLDYRLLKSRLLEPDSRVVIVVRFGIAPQVLMDGIITNHQLTPSNEPGASTLSVTGEDISFLMDREGINRPFRAQSDFAIVTQIVGKYQKYGLTLASAPPSEPKASNPPNPQDERPQTMLMTDRAFLQNLAQQYGFVFYVTPGPLPGFSQVHWGSPERERKQSGELSVNMGPFSNVESINFRRDGLSPQEVAFNVNQRERTISKPDDSRAVPLARERDEPRRKVFLTCGDPRRLELRAQGMVNRSFDKAVTATGKLDVLRYNRLLEPHTLVEVRGAGDNYNGSYQVESVTHTIREGQYTQSFTLTRDGTGQ